MTAKMTDNFEARFDELVRRFDKGIVEVKEAIAEQRRYFEVSFERLDTKLTGMDSNIDEILRVLRR